MADPQTAIADQAHQVSSLAQQLSAQADRLANDVASFSFATGHNADFNHGLDHFCFGLLRRILCCLARNSCLAFATYGNPQMPFHRLLLSAPSLQQARRNQLFKNSRLSRRCSGIDQYLRWLYRHPSHAAHV